MTLMDYTEPAVSVHSFLCPNDECMSIAKEIIVIYPTRTVEVIHCIVCGYQELNDSSEDEDP